MKTVKFIIIFFLLGACNDACYDEAFIISDHLRISGSKLRKIKYLGKTFCMNITNDLDSLEIDSKVLEINTLNDSKCVVKSYKMTKDNLQIIGNMGEMKISNTWTEQELDEFLLLIYLKCWYPLELEQK